MFIKSWVDLNLPAQDMMNKFKKDSLNTKWFTSNGARITIKSQCFKKYTILILYAEERICSQTYHAYIVRKTELLPSKSVPTSQVKIVIFAHFSYFFDMQYYDMYSVRAYHV